MIKPLAFALLFVGAPVMETAVSAESRPARDGNVAIAEELCAARAKATRAAYDLFIARHPDHPLAETARKERAALKENR